LLSTIKWKDIPDFIDTLFEEEFNDNLWTIYLSSPLREGTFIEFKQKVIEDSKPKELVESEAQKAAQNALAMLDGMGGGAFGI
jgi:hypothetical protein